MNKVKRMTVGIVSLVFCVFLAACGTTESPDMPEVIQIQDIDEELPQPSSSGAVDNKEKDEMQDIKEEAEENNSVQPSEVMEGPKDNGSESVDENVDSLATHESESNHIGEQDNSGEDVGAKKVEYVSGSIESVGDSSFTLAKSLIMKSENGGDIAVATTIEADKQIIEVTYTDSTEFIVCTSTDGITGQYSNGSAANLQIGKSADLEGTYEGSDFVAQKITIYIYNIG